MEKAILIVMKRSASDDDVERVKKTIRLLGLKPVSIPGAERTVVGVIGNQGWVDDAPLQQLKGVKEIIHVIKPYKLVGRDFHRSDTVVKMMPVIFEPIHASCNRALVGRMALAALVV